MDVLDRADGRSWHAHRTRGQGLAAATGPGPVVHGIVVMVALLSAGGAWGCSSSGDVDAADPTSSGPERTTATTPSSTEAAAPTAADDLSAYLAAVDEADQRLRHRADEVNAGIGPEMISWDQATLDVVGQAQPTAVARALPPGLDPALGRPALVVYSGLESRYRSLQTGNCLTKGEMPRSELPPSCFTEGQAAAWRYASDLAALRSVAASRPPQPRVTPDAGPPGTSRRRSR